MENAGYLLAAYTFIWVIVFGYLIFMQHKQKRLQRQIELLQKSVASHIVHDK